VPWWLPSATGSDCEVVADLGKLRSESASSAQIEHLTSSARAIALADLGRTGRNNADVIVSNVALQT